MYNFSMPLGFKTQCYESDHATIGNSVQDHGTGKGR